MSQNNAESRPIFKSLLSHLSIKCPLLISRWEKNVNVLCTQRFIFEIINILIPVWCTKHTHTHNLQWAYSLWGIHMICNCVLVCNFLLYGRRSWGPKSQTSTQLHVCILHTERVFAVRPTTQGEQFYTLYWLNGITRDASEPGTFLCYKYKCKFD